jgi:hypothetical protein
MAANDGIYRQMNPRAKVSIERQTENVPKDSKYYVLKDGEVIDSFRNFKASEALYKKLINELNLPPLELEEDKTALGH